MDKNHLEKSSKSSTQLRLIISILVAAILLIADLYVMINLWNNFVILAIVTVLLLIAIYSIVDAALIEKKNSSERTEEQYDNIFKSEKASYLLLRKTFDDLSEMIEKGSGNDNNQSNEEIINAQKAIAKVSISRGKENAEALMNSNDQIIKKIEELEKMISENQQTASSNQEESSDISSEELLKNQSMILERLENIDTSMKNELAQIVNDIKELSEMGVRVKNDTDEVSNINEVSLDTETMPVMDETSIDDILPDPEDELAVEESETPLEEETLSLDDISFEAEEKSAVEESETPLEEETLSLDDISFEPEEESVIEESETPLEQDSLSLDDPLGLNDTPTFDDVEVDTISEPEEKPAMPDMSNPNKVMTPEEIAALIANM